MGDVGTSFSVLGSAAVELSSGERWAWSSGIPRPRLLGREQEVRLIRRLLVEQGHRIVTVSGSLGVGKTQVTLAAAASVIEDSGYASCLVCLESIASAQLVLRAIGSELAIEPERAGCLERIAEAIGQRQMLLVLDNFEHVSDASPGVASLVARCPRLRVLITSRQPLHLADEHIVTVQPLELGLRSPAAQLFEQRAAAAVPGFDTTTSADAATIAHICQRLDGLPLAIELAAQRLRVFQTPRALLAHMNWGVLQLLVGGLADAPARHTSMASAIDSSYQRLSPTQQRLLRRLSIFEGSFTPASAGWVGDDQNAAEALDIDSLQVLLESGLIHPEASHTPEPRFRLRSLTREFAREKLATSGELEIAERCYVLGIIHLAESAEICLQGPHQLIWLDRLADEEANFDGVLRWADENDEVELGARLASALRLLWQLRGRMGDGRVWLQTFASRDAPLDPCVRARILTDAGAAAPLNGQSGRSLVEQLTARERQVAVQIARGLKDREIAAALTMRRSTASWHVRNVLEKLQLSRAQVGVWALENGLLNR